MVLLSKFLSLYKTNKPSTICWLIFEVKTSFKRPTIVIWRPFNTPALIHSLQLRFWTQRNFSKLRFFVGYLRHRFFEALDVGYPNNRHDLLHALVHNLLEACLILDSLRAPSLHLQHALIVRFLRCLVRTRRHSSVKRFVGTSRKLGRRFWLLGWARQILILAYRFWIRILCWHPKIRISKWEVISVYGVWKAVFKQNANEWRKLDCSYLLHSWCLGLKMRCCWTHSPYCSCSTPSVWK